VGSLAVRCASRCRDSIKRSPLCSVLSDRDFGDTDLDISELDVSNAYATDDVSLILELQSTTGQVQYATRLEFEADIRRALFVRIPGTIRASLLHATISGPPHRANVWLDDVRVLGQTPALAAYIKNRLTFPGH
jgi:hypothetical protein